MRIVHVNFRLHPCSIVLLSALPCPLTAEPVSFSRDIAPILVEQCLECHRSGKAKGGYRLDTWEHLQRAGDSESPALTPGDPERSELFRLLVVNDEDDRMPKKGDALAAASIQGIRQWIKEGAVFDASSGQRLADMVEEPSMPEPLQRYPSPLPITALAADPEQKTIAVSGYHEVTLWDAHGNLKARLGGMPERVLGLAWVRPPKGKPTLLVGGGAPGRSGGLWEIDPSDAKPAPRPLLKSRDCLMALAVSPDGSRVVTAGADNSIRCLQMPGGQLLWEIEAHADWVLALATSPDGRLAASASRDRTARLIEIETGEIEATFTAHATAVTSIVFSADGQSVFSGSADGEIRNWNLEGENLKDSTLRAGRTEVLALAPAGGWLLAALADGRMLPLDTAQRKALEPLVTSHDRLGIVQVLQQGNDWKVVGAGHDGSVRQWTLVQTVEEESVVTPDADAQKSDAPKAEGTEKEAATRFDVSAGLHFIASPGW